MEKEELKKYGMDLVVRAEENKIDPVIGREKELDKLLVALSRRKKRNVLFLGDPGVGKTALIEGLAHKLKSQSNYPYKHILSLDMGELMTKTMYRGELETKFENLLKFLSANKDWILFIDEIHTFFSANQSQSMSLGNIIKPYMTGNDIVIIGCTTIEEYNKYLSKDGAFTRRFNIIDVPSTDKLETIEILKKSKEKYEDHHGVCYSDEIIEYATDLAIKFLPHRALPDSAFDIIDEAGGVIKNKNKQKPKEILFLEIELKFLEQERLRIIKDQDWNEVSYVNEAIEKSEAKLEELNKKFNESQKNKKVKPSHLELVTALQANLPLEWVSIGKVSNKWSKIEQNLNKKVRGQENVVKSIIGSIKRKVAGLSSPDRPLACYLLAGAGGTGKTSISYKIAEELWGDDSKVVRFNMSEYMEPINSSKLTGGAPGYVGYESGSPLVREILKHPACVILFDQIELAHSSVLNLLLQILDEGCITDSQGKKARLNQTIILLTTNIGTRDISYKPMGFGSSEVKISETVDKQIQKILTPELVNRLDDILYFQKLNLNNISDIILDRINIVKNRLKDLHNIEVVYSKSIIDELTKQSDDKDKGVWKIDEVIKNTIVDPITEYIIEHSIFKDTKINIVFKNNQIKFTHK